MVNPAIQPYLPMIRKLLETYKVRDAYLFGSVLSSHFTEESDLDIIVNLQDGIDPVDAGENLWNLTFELEDLIHRKVDMHTERSLRNPIFREEVNRTKIPIYG